MKIFFGSLVIISSMFLVTACHGKNGSIKDSGTSIDTTTIADTGYTGIKRYMSGQHIAKDISFRNGIKQGLTTTYYPGGKVRTTFWYENGIRQDSGRWYFEEGQLFRTTPFKNDTVDGIQKQYYRTGKLKAKIGYSKGLRTPFLQEFTTEGKLVGGYPQLTVNARDDYKSKGVYRVILQLSDKSPNVSFYRGDLSGGVFDTAHCQKINTVKGVGYLDLKKTGSPKAGNVGVIAEVLTPFGNKNLIFKKIDLPYSDLN